MADDTLEQMKAFILMTEQLVQSGEDAEPLLELAEAAKPDDDTSRRLIAELRDVIFKLRSYQEESEDDTYALGVEAGMIKASEILENVLTRFSGAGEQEIGG